MRKQGRAAAGTASRRRFAVLGLALCVAAVGLLAGLLLSHAIRPPEGRLGQGPPTPDGHVPDKSAPDEPAADQPAPDEPAADPPQEPAAGAAAGDVPPAPGEPEDSADEPEPDVPPGPWKAERQLGSPARPYPEVVFGGFGAEDPKASAAEMAKWFTSVPGCPGRIEDKGPPADPCAGMEGLLRLAAPWPEDAVLQLEIGKHSGLDVHFFSGDAGATFAHFGHVSSGGWAGYCTARNAGEPRPASYALTSTDQGRYGRTHPGGWVALDVRYQHGSLLLCRGDVRLLTVPLGRPPREVYFDGSFAIRHVRMVRSAPLPEPPGHLRPVVLDADRPSALDWQTQRTDSSGAVVSSVQEQRDPENEPQENVVLDRLPDGRVRLEAEAELPLAWSGVEFSPDGLCEIIFQLEDAEPETGVYLGDAAGAPIHAARFVPEAASQHLVVQCGDPRQPARPVSVARKDAAVPFAGQRTWIRFVCTGSYLKTWISTDGIHWGRVSIRDTAGAARPIGSLGLFCSRGASRHGITLGRILVREFAAINSLAPAELRGQAPAVSAGDPEAWLEQTAASRPADADADLWRAACAIRAFASGIRLSFADRLTRDLLDGGLAADRPLEDRLQLLGEMAEAGNTWQSARYSLTAAEIAPLYEQLGKEVLQGGSPRPFSLVGRRLVTDAIWSRDRSRSLSQSLIHRELVALICACRWEEVHKLCRQLAAYDGEPSRTLEPLAAWGRELASEQLPNGPRRETAPPDAAWRHPLVLLWNKEAYNTLADLEAELAARSYKDACRIITRTPTAGSLGLLPDRDDRRRWLSLPMLVSETTDKHPEVLAAMRAEFEPLGGLRASRAMADGDAAAVAAVAFRFPGTEAADQACLWLGDRAFAGGHFARALSRYSRVRGDGAVPEEDVALRRRLAAAMMGQDPGPPATGKVRFGDAQMTASQFEALVAEMVRRAASAGASPSDGHPSGQSALRPAPAPSGFEVHSRSQFGETPGKFPERLPQPVATQRIDWVARQIAMTVDARLLWVGNRFGVSAYDLASGRQRWHAKVSDEEAMSHDWSLVPMRPVARGGRVFVRGLGKLGPALACLQADTGKRLWQVDAQAGRCVVSDPLFLQDELLALEATENVEQLVVSLVAYQPESGEVLRSTQIAQLEKSWLEIPACGLATWGDSILATIGGGVICCDSRGEVRWMRRQIWWSPAQSPHVVQQHAGPPLVDGGRLYVAQPGVPAVECLDPASGTLLWRSILPEVRRLAGIVDGKLIAEVDDGLLALSASTGKPLWHHRSDGLLQAQLCGPPGGILYACREPAEAQGKLQPLLVWLDAETGNTTAKTSLPGLADTEPMLGPAVMHRNRLWVLFGRGLQDSRRELLELVPKGIARQ